MEKQITHLQIEFRSKTPIQSGIYGRSDLWPGERVILEIRNVGNAWPESIVAIVSKDVEIVKDVRIYRFQFPVSSLNGGPYLKSSDIESARPYTEVDLLRDEVNQQLNMRPKNIVITGKANGSAFFETATPTWGSDGVANFSLKINEIEYAITMKREKGKVTISSIPDLEFQSIFENLFSKQ